MDYIIMSLNANLILLYTGKDLCASIIRPPQGTRAVLS